MTALVTARCYLMTYGRWTSSHFLNMTARNGARKSCVIVSSLTILEPQIGFCVYMEPAQRASAQPVTDLSGPTLDLGSRQIAL
jgi:hypothetical protein